MRTIGLLISLLLLAPAVDASPIEVSGRVVVDGSPLANAEVTLRETLDDLTRAGDLLIGHESEAAARTLTDERGRYRLPAPSPGLWTLRIAARGMAPIETRLTPLIEPVVLADATMEIDAGLRVRVVDERGEPVEDAFVLARPERRRSFFGNANGFAAPLRGARTGPDGVVRLPRAETEAVRLGVSGAGYSTAAASGLRGTAATVDLSRGKARRVRVLGQDGSPVPGVLLATGRDSIPLGFSDADGSLTAWLAAGESPAAKLLAEDGRRLETKIRPAVPTSEEPDPVLELRLPGRVAIAGRLIDARTRAPIGGGLVWDRDDPLEFATTGGGGGYALGGPAGRRVPLVAGAPGYLPGRAMEHQVAGGRPAPTLVLEPGGAIAGRVIDADGEPVAGAEITVEERRAPTGDIRIEIGGGPTLPRNLSDGDGAFRVGPLDTEKAWTVKVSAEGFAPAQSVVRGLEPYRTKPGVEITLSRGRTLTGTIVDEDGSPLAEASVELGSSPRRDHGAIELHGPGPGGPVATARSGDDGRFELAGIAAGRFDLTVRRPGFAKRSLPNVEIADDDSETDVGEIALRPGKRVQGIVRDAAGGPIEGVEVFVEEAAPRMMSFSMPGAPAPQPSAVTDPAGWFVVDDLAGGERYALRFERRGYVTHSVGQVEVPRPEPVEVTLQAASDVSGVVLDPEGEPIAGTRVLMTRSRTAEMGGNVMKMMMMTDETSDAEGAFLFADQEPGTISLSAEASGFTEARLDAVEVPQGEDVTGIELRLDPGASVVGQVLAPDGRPAIGAEVRLVEENSEPFRFGGAPTDGDGRYRLEGLGPGPASIEVTHRDYPRAVRDLDVKEGVNELDFVLEGGVEVEGTVVAADGSPIGAAAVRLTPAGRFWGGPEAVAEPDGRFRIAGVQDGDYTLQANAEGYAAKRDEQPLTVAGEPIRGVEIRLERGGAIAGRVTGLATEDLPKVRVNTEGASFFHFDGAGADYEGNFRLEDLEPGTYNVVAEVAGSGKRASERVTLEAGQKEARVELRFGGGLTLSGKAVQGATPLANVNLFAEGLDVEHEGWTETDPAGRFSIEGLAPGRYRLRLRDWRNGLAHDETVELATSREIELRVPSARLAGTVADSADGEPLSGVMVELHSDNPDDAGRLPTHTSTTDMEGKFEIGGLADGGWRLTATRKGYAALSRTVSVQHDRAPDDLQLAMDATEGLTLEVRLAGGGVPDELRVAVLDAAGNALVGGNYATGENGRVRLSSVPPGQWEILVSGTGSATSTVAVRAPGKPVPVQLAPATGLAVNVPPLVSSPSVATVTVSDSEGRPFRSLTWTGQPQSEWRTTDGKLEFRSLPPGSWTVHVAAADGRSWSGSAATAPGSTAEIVLE